MAVDWEKRIDFDRLRNYRLDPREGVARPPRSSARSCSSIRTTSATSRARISASGQRDKHLRWRAAPTDRPTPRRGNLSSAAKNHRLRCALVPPEESWKAGRRLDARRNEPCDGRAGHHRRRTIVQVPARARARERAARHRRDRHGYPRRRSSGSGVNVVDAQPVMLEARKLKNEGRVRAPRPRGRRSSTLSTRRSTGCLRPGVTRERGRRQGYAGSLRARLGARRRQINAISGERCNPHPHVFVDRLLRPGDQAFFNIVHSFEQGYRTCYYRCFSVGYATPAQLDG